MRHLRHPDSRLWIALALGLWQGLVGTGLFFAWSQCRQAELTLAGDFKLLAFLADGADEERQNMVRESLLFQPDTRSVEFVSKDRALEGLAVREPDLARAAGLLGDNPLPSGFEVKLSGAGIARLSKWLEAAGKIPGIARVEYRAPQADAVVQARADKNFLALILSAGLWLLALAAFYLLIPGFTEPEHLLHSVWESVPVMGWGLGGAAAGTGLALAIALPLATGSPFWQWPPAWGLGIVVASGILTGWIADRLLA